MVPLFFDSIANSAHDILAAKIHRTTTAPLKGWS
jgi:hypothetical protein